jgi:hypothetical protein
MGQTNNKINISRLGNETKLIHRNTSRTASKKKDMTIEKMQLERELR